MSPVASNISDRVRDVLSRATITETSVALNGQLDRDLYEDVNKVLVGAGGKWNRKAKAHVFDRDPREVLGLAITTGKAANIKKDLQAFYAPEPLARRMVMLAEIKDNHRVIEPSAGMGAIADQIVTATGVRPLCVDIDSHAVETLIEKGHKAIRNDFLTFLKFEHYDRFVMNPPFTGGQDMAHVTHAIECTAPGGRVVALMSPSWQRLQTKKAKAFRSLVEPMITHAEDVPAGTFKESGTNVATVLIVIDKPQE